MSFELFSDQGLNIYRKPPIYKLYGTFLPERNITHAAYITLSGISLNILYTVIYCICQCVAVEIIKNNNNFWKESQMSQNKYCLMKWVHLIAKKKWTLVIANQNRPKFLILAYFVVACCYFVDWKGDTWSCLTLYQLCGIKLLKTTFNL